MEKNKLVSIEHELKTENRFLVEFPEQFNVDSTAIQKLNKPKFKNYEWENIKIVFFDPIAPSTSQSLFNIVNFLKTNNDDNKKLFEFKIKSFDPTGIKIEEWIVYVEQIITINFGELNYGSDDIQKPYLIIKPLNCILKY